MIEFAIFKNILVALALGALIGLEREYAKYRKKGHEYAGVRTFPLIALFGALSALFADLYSQWILIVGILIMAGLIIASYVKMAGPRGHHVGTTSEVAGFLTFFIGVLAYVGQLNLAIALAVIITIILYSRSILHHFTKAISKVEMGDTLKFAVIAFVILPFLPNQGYGPHELFNPYVIWLMVVLISGISFAGYILMKWFGERGIELTGILGGLVSSTAVTSSFAARSKKEPKLYKPLILGVILANGIMFVRILIEVFVVNRALFPKMLIPMLTLAIVTAIFSYFIWRKSDSVEGKVNLKSPFTLGPALKFGAFFAVILALVKIADIYFAQSGVYLVSIISGFADVDAITVSLSQLAKSSLAENIARNGIVLAALTNVAVKGGIALLFGGKKFGRIIASFYAVLIVLGVLLVFVL